MDILPTKFYQVNDQSLEIKKLIVILINRDIIFFKLHAIQNKALLKTYYNKTFYRIH
jgi:hypothetical protein